MTTGEAERVRTAYARRTRTSELYDNRRPEVVNALASRARAWGAGLLAADHDLGRVLEVGAGEGSVLRWLTELGATLAVGVDIQADRLHDMLPKSDRTLPVLADGRSLPIRPASVDTVVCSTLFSSVLDDTIALAIAGAIDRALRPGGLVLWYDLRRSNPRNPDVRPVKADDLSRWFPGYAGRLRSASLMPPLARRVSRSTALSLVLEAVPLLRTHLAGHLVKP